MSDTSPVVQNLLTVREVANIFRVSTLTIRRWSDKGVLPAIKINKRGDRRFSPEDINLIVENRSMTPTSPDQ